MNKISWQLVAIGLAGLAAIVYLKSIDADTSDIMTVLVAFGIGGGAATLSAIKSNTNGSNAALLAEVAESRRVIERLSLMLANMQPIPTATPADPAAPASGTPPPADVPNPPASAMGQPIGFTSS